MRKSIQLFIFVFVFAVTFVSGADMMGVAPDLGQKEAINAISENTGIHVSTTTFVVGTLALCGMIYQATKSIIKFENRLENVEKHVIDQKEHCRGVQSCLNMHLKSKTQKITLE